jgi:hypothetical protein
LSRAEAGIRIADFHLNHVAYADDVNLKSYSASGLQNLINECFVYSENWRFKFGLKKSKCVYFGKPLLKEEPHWLLGKDKVFLTNDVDILGVTFSHNLDIIIFIDISIVVHYVCLYLLFWRVIWVCVCV